MALLVSLYQTVVNKLEKIPLADFPLGARLAVAFPFWSSGRAKTGEGFLDLNEFAIYPFEEDYSVPFLEPELAAQMALYAETFLPIMLVLGLGGRFAAAGLLFMIFVITISYPGHNWMETASWGVALLAILIKGSGRISIDHLVASRLPKHA